MWNNFKNILIVDDDVTVLRLLRRLLEKEYCLAEASNGELALAMLAGFAPHLVMLDIMMPGIDGYETCHRIRRNPASRGIQIAMVSAKSSRDEMLRAYAAGADDYIVKPFDPHELYSRVRLHFRLCCVSDTIGPTSGDGGSQLGATVLKKGCAADQPASAIPRAVGIKPSMPAPRPDHAGLQFRFDSLHWREREAMARIVDGVPNKTIARQLGVSHRTANRIRAAVFKKMEVASAVDLARIVGEFADPRIQS